MHHATSLTGGRFRGTSGAFTVGRTGIQNRSFRASYAGILSIAVLSTHRGLLIRPSRCQFALFSCIVVVERFHACLLNSMSQKRSTTIPIMCWREVYKPSLFYLILAQTVQCVAVLRCSVPNIIGQRYVDCHTPLVTVRYIQIVLG